MSGNIDKLKELLFETESRSLDDLRSQLAAEAAKRAAFDERFDLVYERVGDDARLQTSVANVLDGALRDAEVARHGQLSDAIAPLVVRTIKTEIFSSRDALVEAIHPSMGRMVKSYVASAMKDLADQINRKLEANPLMVAVQVLATGQSPARIAMAHAQPLEVEELFLIRRGSGELLARFPEAGASSNQDQVMSGVLTAINEFASEAFANDGGALRQIDMGATQLYLRASPTYLLAAKCIGQAPAAVEEIIDAAFLETIEAHDHILSAAAQNKIAATDSEPPLLALAENLETRVELKQREIRGAIRKGPSPVKILLWLIGLPLAAWFAWSTYVSYETGRVERAAVGVIDGEPRIAGYPVRVGVTRFGETVSVAGLMPTPETKADVIAGITEVIPAGSTLIDLLRVLPAGGNPELPAELQRLRTDLSAVQTGATQDAIARAVARADAHLAGLDPLLSALPSALPTTVSPRPLASTQSDIKAARAVTIDLSKTLSIPVQSDVALEPLRAQMSDATAKVDAAALTLSGLLGATISRGLAPLDPISSSASLVDTAERLALKSARLATVAVAIDQAARLPRPVPAMTPPEPTAREKLQAWTRDNAIFFSSEVTYRDAAETRVELAQLAALLRDAGSYMRVVGYTDDRGSADRNETLSQRRAAKVRDELIALGIRRDQLIAVGRRDGAQLSGFAGDDSPNRRVQFELGFANERQR